jgi:hypothetical protein
MIGFMKAQKDQEWFITIPPGKCPPDEILIKTLTHMCAGFNKSYVSARYHKLGDPNQFSMILTFEGEVVCGTRHAHILVKVPTPRKRHISRDTLISWFPFEFRWLWQVFNPLPSRFEYDILSAIENDGLTFGRANTARKIYTAKDVRQSDVSWSRLEFIPPAKTGSSSESLSKQV